MPKFEWTMMTAHLATVELQYDGFVLILAGQFDQGEPAIHSPIDRADPGTPPSFAAISVTLLHDGGEPLDITAVAEQAFGLGSIEERACNEMMESLNDA